MVYLAHNFSFGFIVIQPVTVWIWRPSTSWWQGELPQGSWFHEEWEAVIEERWCLNIPFTVTLAMTLLPLTRLLHSQYPTQQPPNF